VKPLCVILPLCQVLPAHSLPLNTRWALLCSACPQEVVVCSLQLRATRAAIAAGCTPNGSGGGGGVRPRMYQHCGQHRQQQPGIHWHD
jgi:hypothetical protein